MFISNRSSLNIVRRSGDCTHFERSFIRHSGWLTGRRGSQHGPQMCCFSPVWMFCHGLGYIIIDGYLHATRLVCDIF